MLTHTTLLISKMDPIKYIFEKPALSRRIVRWQMVLTEYDIQYTTQKEIKGSVLDDHLAHQVIDDYQSMSFEFPDENIMLVTDYEEPRPNEGPGKGSQWTMVFDSVIGGSGTDCLTLVREMSRKQESPPSFIFSKWKGQKHRKIS